MFKMHLPSLLLQFQLVLDNIARQKGDDFSSVLDYKRDSLADIIPTIHPSGKRALFEWPGEFSQRGFLVVYFPYG